MDQIIVTRKNSFYRPWYIPVNGKEYKILKIKIFNESGVLYTSVTGWFEERKPHYHRDIDQIVIDAPILKRIENFDTKQNYIISKGKEDYGTDLTCILYLHESVAGFELLESHVLELETETRKVYTDLYIITINDISFVVEVGYNEEITEFGKHVNDIQEQFKELNIGIDGYLLTELLSKFDVVRKA